MAYTCSGTVQIDEVLASGIEVRLYKRANGALVGSAITTVSGTFTIESAFNEYHYLVAMSQWTTTNSLIYDWISPTVSG
jgi:hypothetical protein